MPIIKSIINASIWGILGIIITVCIFLWQEYHSKYNLKFELEEELNLIEVRENIPSLKILYNDENILTSKKEIKILKVTLKNEGETILQQFYDQLEPFGIQFTNARILSIDIIDSNSEDIKRKIIGEKNNLTENYNNRESEFDKVYFSKVIFEKDKYVTFKIVVLTDQETKVNVSILGKIANIESLKFSNIKKKINRLSLDEFLPIFLLSSISILIFATLFLYFLLVVEKQSKNKKISRFMKRYPILKKDELTIIQLFLSYNGWPIIYDKLIINLLEDHLVINLHDYLKERLIGPFDWVLNLIIPKRYNKNQFLTLPKEIFTVVDINITLNQENKLFLEEMLKENLIRKPFLL